jgi:hypothetical protein
MCTQWVFKGCSILTQLHSHAFRMFRGCSTLTQRHPRALNSIQGVFNTHSKAYIHTLNRIWVQINSHTYVIFLMVIESHSIRTQWRSCTIIGSSHLLNGIHAHSMGVQELFPLTHWPSCAFNGCSGAVHNHSLAFTRTHKYSGGIQDALKCVHPVHILKGPIRYVSNMWSTLRLYKFALNFHWMSFFVFAKQEDLTSHLKTWFIGGLGVCQWDCQQKIIKYHKKGIIRQIASII